MVAPVTVNVEEGPGGKVEISEGEYTSEGFALNGLNPMEIHSAGIACCYTGGPYIEPGYGTEDCYEAPYDLRNNTNRIVNIIDGSIVGYKYFNFNGIRRKPNLKLGLVPEGVDGTITVWTDRPWESQEGKVLGSAKLDADMPQESTELVIPVHEAGKLKGKHAIFLTFASETKDKSLCALESLVFN